MIVRLTLCLRKLASLICFFLIAPFSLTAQPKVVINEIMYAPANPEPEWIELYNTDSAAINLTNWRVVTTSKSGTLPYGVIQGHGYLLLTKDSLTLVSVRPGANPIVQMPLPILPNAGTNLFLLDSALQTVDSLSYLPSWGGSNGSSLERRDIAKPATDPINWGTSQDTSGATPGARNSIAAPDSTPTIIPAHPLDIVMNEIMFAPVKPEPEWIELLNTTTDTINLAGWMLAVEGHAPISIPAINAVLPPDSMLILSSNDSALATFRGIPIERIVRFGLSNLNNSGSTLALRDALGDRIDSAYYDGSWIKADGISIERIDPAKSGYYASNWKACEDSSGSTILRPNSVRKREHDLALLGVYGVDTSVIFSIGNSGRDTSHQLEIRLQIDNLDTIATVLPIFLPPDSMIRISIPLPQNFYGLFHGFACITDSLDEQHSNDTIRFNITLAVPQDSLVINEIMFDPQPASCEWLEVYNRSSRWISLDSARLITGEKRPGEYSHTVKPLLISPNSFGLIAADSTLLLQEYPSLRHGMDLTGLGVSTLDLGKDSCFVTLHNLDSTVIDSVHYFKTWQQSLLRKTFVGISLERIDAGGASNDPRNWQACIDSAGATPLKRNSIASATKNDTILPAGTSFHADFSPNPFSPDGDGFQDATTLTIQTGDAASGSSANGSPTSAWAMRVRIYDARGEMVRMLSDATQIVGATAIAFDGKRDNGQTLSPGLYTVLIELTSQSPLRTMRQEIGVVIAGKRR